jgi:hypothetical protein
MPRFRLSWWAFGLGAMVLGCGSNKVTSSDGGLDGPATDATKRPDSSPSETGAKETGPNVGTSVLTYHLDLARSGHYVESTLTPSAAMTMKLDPAFTPATIQGPLYGQVLYMQNGVGGKGTFYAADNNNNIYAFDESSGSMVWQKLMLVANGAGGQCGQSPVGVIGTPVIDPSSRIMYFVAAVSNGGKIQTQQIHALSIDTGDEVTTPGGWPIDVSKITSSGDIAFNPPPQGQRGGITLVDGFIYVAWGGEDGDCGTYHGWVVAVPVATPTMATGWTTGAVGGGAWNTGGLASDGTDVFLVTGNATQGCGHMSPWSDCNTEAVIRFHNGTSFDPSSTTDFFTPSNWVGLDDGDTDLTGASPLVVDVPGATPSSLVIAMGKSGVIHLLDLANLGGIGKGNGTTGEGVYSNQAGSGPFRGSAAAYTTSKGTYVVAHTDGGGTKCPSGTGGDLVAVQIAASSPPTFTTAWCASTGSNGSPIVTTTDSSGSNPIVWIVGGGGLLAFDGETGASIFSGGGIGLDGSNQWTTPIEANGRIIVGSSDKIYAFKPQ